jgi:adenosylmethionine-8-amino-7-oxononanoate aminotransferase
MFLIPDEARTALGRLGPMFGFERLGIVPDFPTIPNASGTASR